MSRGPSGRLVIEVDPILKRALHSALAAEGLTLKGWFLQRVVTYITEHHQPLLPGIAMLSHAGVSISQTADDDAAGHSQSTEHSVGGGDLQ